MLNPESIRQFSLIVVEIEGRPMYREACLSCESPTSLGFCVDGSDECHARNVHQPELVCAFLSGLLQLVDGALVPIDSCSPN
jgi:hypothetical protein